MESALSGELYGEGKKLMLLFDIEGYKEAVPLFLQALERDGANPLIYAALSETYSFWGSRREKNGQECLSYYDLSYQSASKALEMGPLLSEAHRAMAISLRAGTRHESTAAKIEALRAYELNAYDGENCCELWRASGYDPEDPLIHKAIALMPSLCAAHIDLAVALCGRNRLDEAAFHLRKAIEINARNSLAYYNLAMVKLRQGALAQAERILKTAAQMHPEDPLVLSGVEWINTERAEASGAGAA